MIHSLKNIFSLFKGKGLKLFVCFLFALLSITAKLAIPFLSGKAIDILRTDFSFDSLLPYLYLILGLLIFGAIMRYFFDFLANRLVEEVLSGLRKDLYASYLDSTLSSLEKRKQGDLLSCLLGDMDTLQKGLISGATAVYEGIVQILLTIVFMFLLSPILSAAVIVLTPISKCLGKYPPSLWKPLIILLPSKAMDYGKIEKRSLKRKQNPCKKPLFLLNLQLALLIRAQGL